ncbi:hypothetical protein BBP40_008334 [Aspergillus hancockii]|nr:hypothetical protein BBP40_008334 [Aspergillus hancockii]
MAFCTRAALTHQFTSCFHESFPEIALARAQYLDDCIAEHKKPHRAIARIAHFIERPAPSKGKPAYAHEKASVPRFRSPLS